MNTLLEQYRLSADYFAFSLEGSEAYAAVHGGDGLWLMGAADNFCELAILEDRLLDAMEGLA